MLASLVRNIEQVSHGHVGTGLVGAQWLMRTLSDNGHADIAYEIATQKTYPGWGYMVEKGATTIWELWNGDTADPAMNSGNHVMQIGDLAVWMYEYLAGIRSDPREARLPARSDPPLSGGRSDVRESVAPVDVRHDRELVEARSRLVHAGRHGSANTTATVWLPAKDSAAVTESGKPANGAKGVKFVRAEGDRAVFEVESGTYSFRGAL